MKAVHLVLAGLAVLVSACATTSSVPSAEMTYRWTPNSDPNAARAYSSFLIGRYAALTNDPREAARRYAEAVAREPGDADLVERAVFAALLSGDMDAAADIARASGNEVIAQAALPRLALAVEALADGEGKTARKILSKGDYTLFNDLVNRGLLAWALYTEKGAGAALKTVSPPAEAVGLERGISSFTRALIQHVSGDDAAALETFETMWAEGARFAAAAELQARLTARAGRPQDALNVLAEFQSDIGDNPAIEALQREIIAGKTPPLKRLTARQGAALSMYAPAALLAAQTQGDVSGVYFSLALALDPDLHVARTLWANALDEAGRRGDAILVLENVPATSPFYVSARGQLAWALRREERNDEALRVAEDALQHRPHRDLKIQLGDLFRSLGRHGEAGLVFDEILEADEAEGRSEDWRILYARGAARERMGRWPEAEADLIAALELAPNDPSLLNYLGYSWIDRGINMEKGFDLIRKAVSLRPQSGMIVDSLGWAHFKHGEYDEAVRYLERAVELEPGDPVLNDHLGDAYWKVGRRLEAGFQWQRSLNLQPDESAAEKTRAKLNNGLPDDNARLAANLR